MIDRARKVVGQNATVTRQRCGFYEERKDWHPPLRLKPCSGRMMGAQQHAWDCPGNQPYVTIGVTAGVGGIGFNVIKGAGRTVDDAIADVIANQAADRLRYASDGICTAPRGACGFGRRSARKPARVGADGTLICHCGSPMRRAKGTK